jgi:hypothetical protein
VTSGFADRSTLLAVCDVLVVKALESMGKWLLRVGGRSRMGEFAASGLPLHKVHTRWQDNDDIVSRALRGAWDVVPAMLDDHGCCGVTSREVTAMLDDYVHDLVVSGTEHSVAELRYRFETRLGLVAYDLVRR